MRHVALRTTFATLGAAATLAAILTACGGGGSSSTPTAQTPVAVPSASANQTIDNFSGPSSTVTVSIKVPPRTEPAASFITHLKALYGAYRNDPHLRTMANTSPSQQIRTLGTQIHAAANRYEASTRRDPTFIPGASEYLEFVLTNSSNTVLVDSTYNDCNTESCTGSFDAPVGTGFTVTLYLYDDCDFLIAAGSVNNVSVTSGQTTPVTVTMNGVVAHFDVTDTANPNPMIADPSAAQTFNVNVAAYDWDGDLITSSTNPNSVLLDDDFNQITGVQLAVSGISDISPSTTQTVNAATNLSFPSTQYMFAGTSPSDSNVTFTATEISGPNVVSSFNTECCGTASTQSGNGSITIDPVLLQWTNAPENYSGTGGDPEFSLSNTSSNPTLETVEIPNGLNNTTSYTFGLSENIAFGGTVTITDNGSCSGITTGVYNPSSGSFSSLASGITFTMASSGSSQSCTIIANDSAGRTADLTLDVDQSTLTIESKTRSAR